MGRRDPSRPDSVNISFYQGDAKAAGKDAQKKKEEPPPELTPLEKLLQNAGPVREDGSDKFFGLENVRISNVGTPGRITLMFSSSVWEYLVSLPALQVVAARHWLLTSS